RSELPGAFVYDRVAAALRDAEASGVPIEARLVTAFPASWLVNAKTPSSTMRRWSEPPGLDVWTTLVDAVAGGPERWLARDEATRADVVRCIEALGPLGAEGDAIEAISKVLALAVSEGVPLMPAESRAFALETDAGGATTFLAMLDWFSRAMIE